MFMIVHLIFISTAICLCFTLIRLPNKLHINVGLFNTMKAKCVISAIILQSKFCKNLLQHM